MKKLSLVLHIVLFLLVGVLFYLHFSSPKAEEVETTKEDPLSEPTETLKLAYVNLDSLEANYGYFQSKVAELNKKQQRIQNELATLEREIQNDIQDLQKRGNSLSPAEIEKVQQKIIEKRQRLQQRDQTLGEQFMKEQQEFNAELHNKIQSFLNKYNTSKNYDFIFSYSNEGSPVLIGNDAFDITNEILSGLNQKNDTAAK